MPTAMQCRKAFDIRCDRRCPMGGGQARRVLARKLCLLRRRYQCSQEALAAKSGLHRSYISALERSRRNISLDRLERLVSTFGLGVAQLSVPSDPEVHGPAVRTIKSCWC